jgi:tetratricopeptide (TPR) repeat protein
MLPCREEADEVLRDLEMDSAIFLRALIAFLHGGKHFATKALVRRCLLQSNAQHGGAWLLLASLLGQSGNLNDALQALETGLKQQSATPWLSCLLCARAHIQLAMLDCASAQNSLAAAVAHSVDKSQAAVV